MVTVPIQLNYIGDPFHLWCTMNDAVQQQTCRLCLRSQKLCNSHFMPAVFYRHLGLDDSGNFQSKALPRLTRDRLMHVPKHVTKHLLCTDCERRFSKGGEGWVSRLGYQVGRSFGLQATLKTMTPRLELPSGRVYAADDNAAIDWGKLAYFALSVFWRGACDHWDTRADNGPFIEMDPVLQEGLRRFLLGESGHLPDAMLMVRIASSRRGPAHLMSFPSRGNLTGPDWRAPQYTFMVPGMIFTLVPGPGIPPEYVRQGCLIHGDGHPLFMMASDELFVREQVKLLMTAKLSQKIIDEVMATVPRGTLRAAAKR